ncbi:hypothetical protein UFOVP46_76 [uncultured Caudovirales phage]|uniref:Uncharacterized protein n=1 Tax=uncultured Caudovirales phage TaxID=2100421 RepID=A0A6J5KS12_9CAUD|nr:hypothetical protein UFOVP46_76 [uncultured Caudovirales phage]
MSNIETYFLITVNTDGTLTSYAQIPTNLPEGIRPANNMDIYEAAKQIVDEFTNQLLADRIVRAVVSAMTPPPEEKVSDRLSALLEERGIKPESVSPAE